MAIGQVCNRPKYLFKSVRTFGSTLKLDTIKPWNKRSTETACDTGISNPEIRQKRAKGLDVSDPRDKLCIICNHIKCQNVSQRFRLSEEIPSENLLRAIAFYKDEVYTRCIFLKTVKDAYATDLMYHGNCLNKYSEENETTPEMQTIFDEVVQTFKPWLCHIWC